MIRWLRDDIPTQPRVRDYLVGAWIYALLVLLTLSMWVGIIDVCVVLVRALLSLT